MSSQPRAMPSRSLRTPSITSKRHSSSGAKEKKNGPAESGSATESVPMDAPISPSVTLPPVLKARATGGVSSRSKTATWKRGPSSWRVPSSNTKRNATSTSGSAPAALKPSKSRTASGRTVAVPSAAFHVAEKKAAAGPTVSIAARRDRSPSKWRLATQAVRSLPSAMLVGTPLLDLTTGMSCPSLPDRWEASAADMNKA